MKHILYLPSWFPNRNDPYSGDFLLRHAEAASFYNRITIFFTAADDKIDTPEIVEEKINKNLSAYIYYYPPKKGMLSSAINGIKRFFALRKLYEKVFRNLSPDLVHVHVAYPAGLFALYLKKRKGLDYIISEQHTIYMLGADYNLVRGQSERQMVSVVYSNAKKIHTVSKSLADSLVNLRLATNEPLVIPNVVNTEIFKYEEKKRGKPFCFIHVSLLINQKNPEGMLAAFAQVKKTRDDFVLRIIGPATEQLINLAKDLMLEKEVIFMGEMPYSEVAAQMRKSDAMVHFTRYETFGCVIAESLCCGVPVIVSELDVTKELITDRVNGLLVKEGDVKDLAEKILFFMENGLSINAKQIAEESEHKFNYRHVGKTFDEMYNSVISSR